MMLDAAVQRLAFATITIVCLGGAPMARAQDTSVWQKELHAAARLVAGAALTIADTKWLRAGIEIRLDPGWKTYWRAPGDSGMPPTFSFAGSENVKSVIAQWPAPERFADGAGGHSIGYLGHIVLPLRILPVDAAKPSSLRVKFGYAICGNLCVPAEADLGLMLSGKAGSEEEALILAEARVPRRVPLGMGGGRGDGLAVRSVHREADGAQQRIVVDVAAPNGLPVDLFVEGPTPDWGLTLPEPEKAPANGAPGLRRFSLELDELPPGAHAEGATLTFTAVSPTDAIEVEARLD
jgi:DsbC/DsbD-like thiol-disulfide interchange protein